MTEAQTLPGPLAGLRILELADEKGQFCGKLMGDLGADVIKIEPPGGEATRRVGPFLDDIPHPERSLSFWYYNTSKRGITLNLETADGRQLFRRLAAATDVILETFPPGYLSSLGLGYENLREQNPGLIMCALTPFGQTGPWRDYMTSDLLHMAAGGQMASCGYDEVDAPGPHPSPLVGAMPGTWAVTMPTSPSWPPWSTAQSQARAVYRCLDPRGPAPSPPKPLSPTTSTGMRWCDATRGATTPPVQSNT